MKRNKNGYSTSIITKQMLTQFLMNDLGLGFLMSDEDGKFFGHYGAYAFLYLFFSLHV